MKFPCAKFPFVRRGHREHGVTIFRVAGNPHERHQARIARALRPVGRLVRGRMRELPVGHALHHGEDGLWRNFFHRLGGDERLLAGRNDLALAKLKRLRARLRTEMKLGGE